MKPTEKYLMPDGHKKGLYRLTLTPKAFALAIQHSKPIAGVMSLARKDGKFDVMVSPAVADQLDQLREEGEHRWDVVVRLLTPKAVAQ